MSHLGHFVVFWLAGLLTGTLLGWMLGRSPAGGSRARNEEQAGSRNDRARAA